MDVSIIGAGPAGAAAALSLAGRGYRVTLYSADDQEPVGETLPPEITPLLREAGVFEDFLALDPLESPGVVSIWGDSELQERDFIGNPHGNGWHVNRTAFDAMLRRKAQEAGAQLVRRRVRETPPGFVIDASGATALRAPEDVLVAIVLRLETRGGSDLRTYIEATRDGWWYSGPAVAMFFTDPEIYRAEGIDLAELLTRSPLLRRRAARLNVTHSRVVQVRTGLNPQIAGPERLCVGDSASAYDPVSGLGIWKALRMAALAHDPEAAAATAQREFAAYSAARRAHYASETRWPESGFWRRRLAQPSANAL